MNPKYLRDIPVSTVSSKQVSSIRELKSRNVQVVKSEEVEIKEPTPDDADYVLASSSEEEEDEDAELMLELEKIRQEREAEKEQLEEALMDSTVKRKWTDDVLFKNQANDAPKLKKRFINDTIRSDFHKKFLYRFIK
jgi:protein CWC15